MFYVLSPLGCSLFCCLTVNFVRTLFLFFLEVCKQSKQVGRGRAAFRRVYYDSETRSCKNFIFGGVGGNLNNFKSMAACEEKCAQYIDQTSVGGQEDICQLPKEKVKK